MESQDGKSNDAPPIASASSPPGGEATEPMTGRLMTRLFMVPALIVCLLLAVAVVVVLFGSTSLEKQVSTDDLSRPISRSRGASMSMILCHMPIVAGGRGERQLEQKEVPEPAEIAAAADRIAVILNKYEPGRDADRAGSHATGIF